MENNRKEIEELAKDLRENYSYEKCPDWGCSRCEYEKYGPGYFCKNMYQAEKIYALGYRKITDDLINRQKAEIEKSKNSCDKCGEKTRDCIESLQNIIAEQKAEIERLQKAIQVQEIMLGNQDYAIKRARDKTITEFENRLEEEAYGNDLYDRRSYGVEAVTVEEIRQIAKELKEGIK